MFRMKSNAVLLTVITTVSALALGLLSLSYISFYSAEKSAKLYVPSDFILTDIQEADQFKEALTAENLMFTEKITEVIQVDANMEKVLGETPKSSGIVSKIMTLPVISENELEGIDVSPDETYFTKTSSALDNLISMKDEGPIEFKGAHEVIPQTYTTINKDAPILGYFTGGGLPVAIVDETVFERLQNNLDPALQKNPLLISESI